MISLVHSVLDIWVVVHLGVLIVHYILHHGIRWSFWFVSFEYIMNSSLLWFGFLSLVEFSSKLMLALSCLEIMCMIFWRLLLTIDSYSSVKFWLLFCFVFIDIPSLQHAYTDGRLEEVVLRHLGSDDGSTVIAKDIRFTNLSQLTVTLV